MVPNFIICGAQKSGTTTLFHLLRNCKDVFMSPQKEVNFFSAHYDKGMEWYEMFFKDYNGERAVGEASPDYMVYPGVPERIATSMPRVKIVFVLRNPIVRAYSAYLFYSRVYFSMYIHKNPKEVFSEHVRMLSGASVRDFDPSQPFSKAIRSKGGYEVYIKRGFYYDHIKRFTEHIGKERILIILYRDLISDPGAEISRCLSFLGIVPAGPLPEEISSHNPALYPRSISINKIFYRSIRPFINNYIWPKLPRSIKRNKDNIHNFIYKTVFSGKIPPMNGEDRKYLGEIYKDQNALLSKAIGKDLTFWK